MVNELSTKQPVQTTTRILEDTMTKRTTSVARLLAHLKEWAYAMAFPVALIGGALFVLVMHASRAPL